MFKILVVDDSAFMRKVICDIINSDDNFHVADESGDGEDAYNKIRTRDYDFILLDMILPKMTALQLLSKLAQEQVHCNVILMSSSLKEDTDGTLQAMERGALDFVLKPLRSSPESRVDFGKNLLRTMHVVANACRGSKKTLVPDSNYHTSIVEKDCRKRKNVNKFVSFHNPAVGRNVNVPVTKENVEIHEQHVVRGRKLVALACSTGGPQALLNFVPMLPENLSCPLVIVQHIPAGFSSSLATRLNQVSTIHVKEAEDKELLQPGVVYVTPGGKHMEIFEDANHNSYCHLNDDPPIGSLKPCADVMYRSLVNSSYEEIICVVLTGMGADGSEGIKELSKHKSTYVISQDASSCVVFGMPKAVAAKGLSNEVVPLDKVANSILKRLGGL